VYRRPLGRRAEHAGAGEINWLLYWPEASSWPDSTAAADALMAACLDQLRRWQVTRRSADGALPAPGVYGLPEQWPHIRALYERAGFVHDGHTEIVLLARVDELPRPSEPPVAGLEVRRTVGINGTRLSGSLGEKLVGYIEVDTNLAEGGRRARRPAGHLHPRDGGGHQPGRSRSRRASSTSRSWARRRATSGVTPPRSRSRRSSSRWAPSRSDTRSV
jgi:hypothetical protein